MFYENMTRSIEYVVLQAPMPWEKTMTGNFLSPFKTGSSWNEQDNKHHKENCFVYSDK